MFKKGLIAICTLVVIIALFIFCRVLFGHSDLLKKAKNNGGCYTTTISGSPTRLEWKNTDWNFQVPPGVTCIVDYREPYPVLEICGIWIVRSSITGTASFNSNRWITPLPCGLGKDYPVYCKFRTKNGQKVPLTCTILKEWEEEN